MIRGINVFIYPVKDLPQAKGLYRSVLGIEPYMEGPYYVGFRIGDQEIGLDPQGHRNGLRGPVSYWEVDDIRDSLQSFIAAGGQAQQEVRDIGGGKLIATVNDADGNTIGLMQSPPAHESS